MPTIFQEMHRAKLEAEIHELLSTSLHEKSIEELAVLQSILQNYLEKDVSERWKRAMRKSLAEIESMLPSEDIDTSPPVRPECLIQIPSKEDLMHMRRMPAGSYEDQQQRLSNMANLIASNKLLPVTSTDGVELKEAWLNLFNAIDNGKNDEAYALLAYMTEEKDPLLQLLLTVHPLEYLQTLILNCIQARGRGFKNLKNDIIITPKTFELLIKDLSTTLYNLTPLYFSFGLPSHHAYRDKGSGFCILNKIALLINHAKQQYETPLKHVIIGMDVNRDNGLCQVLRDSASHLDITHIDIFDSRVYPLEDFAIIDKEFPAKTRAAAREICPGIIEWPHTHYDYIAADLSLIPSHREAGIHQAVLFAITQMRTQVSKAKTIGQQVMMFLPTGWDSHKDETAECGKLLDGARFMTKTEAQRQRFTNNDLEFFYQQVIQLYRENKETITGIYWGLEGGYDRKLYLEQIELLLTTVHSQLATKPEAEDGEEPAAAAAAASSSTL